MVRYHHQLNGHEFKQTPGDSEEQGRLACYKSMGSQRIRQDLGTEQLKRTGGIPKRRRIQTFPFFLLQEEAEKGNYFLEW